MGDFAVADGVAACVRVEGGALHGEDFAGENGVVGAVDAGVDAQAKDVLVVAGEDAGVDDGAPGDGDVGVDGLGGDDARGADFVGEFAGLVEDEGEDVFVVGDGDDGLEDEFAGARDGRCAGAVVGVFPADASVLLVDADDVVHGERLAFVVGEEARKVVDAAEAVAAKFEIVGHDACTSVAEVEGRLAVEGGTRVGVRDVHVREGEAVEEGPVVVADVVDDHAFTLIEAVTEGPFLPVDNVAGFSRWCDGEACSFRLHYVQRLDVGSQFLIFSCIFVAFWEVNRAPFRDFRSRTGRQSVDADDFRRDSIHDRRNWKWESIMVSVLVVRIGWVTHVQEGLAHSLVVVNAIRTWFKILETCR